MKTASMPVNPGTAAGTEKRGSRHPLLWTLLFVLIVLSFLFFRSFDSDYALFANDCPLGQMTADQNRPPGTLTGSWGDLNWLGNESLNSTPSLSNVLLYLPTPNIWSRFEQPFTLLVVGLCACFCLRKFGLSPLACILGGLAATLNSDFFSTSCWGVSSRTIGFGAMYIAVGMMYNPGRSWRHLLAVIVAGMAVGMGIMEAYDIGAIFSLFVAAFVMFAALFLRQGDVPGKIGQGVGQVVLLAGFAGLVAAYSLTGLISTQLKGSVGSQQDAESKRQRYDAYTYWSVPKAEILQVLIPGVFGYRQEWHMYEDDQPQEDQYWGTIGASPGMWRLVGTGFYAGVPVVLIAFWAIFQSFCRRGSAFTTLQRRSIWFWFVALVISALLAFGRHAPFYQLFYALPYASAIRNPQKFMHVFSWAIVILFGYGVHGIAKLYMQTPVTLVPGAMAQFKNWYAKAMPFEKKWITGCVITLGVALLGWLMYVASGNSLETYIGSIGIKPAEIIPKIVKYSQHAVGWFIILFIVTVALLALIFSGQFSGARAKWGGIFLGALLVFDLALADKPWIVYWNIPYKYASDSVIKFLADKPYEHRVSLLPVQVTSQQHALLFNAYGSAWKQQIFPYNNIQCAEVIQEPREPIDKEEFMRALPQNSLFNFLRFWQLANTRYILGPGGDFMSHMDPGGKQFRVLKKFNFVPKGPVPTTQAVDYKAVEDPNGELAVYEFLNALPRAKLFSNWQVSTNDDVTLKTVVSPDFDPLQSVLVSDAACPAPLATNLNQPAGTVEITSYKPKHVELQADVKTPSVLLMSDKYNPKWVVEVDGKPAQLLRCDFILRGIYLERGSHKIVFRFVPPLTTLYVSLAAIALGLLFSGILMVSGSAPEKDPDDSEVAGK